MNFRRKLKQDGKNSLLLLVIGVVFVIVGAWFCVGKLLRDAELDMFDWAYVAFFAIIGIYFLLKGVKAISNDPFVEITDEYVAFKKSSDDLEKKAPWHHLSKIETTPYSVTFFNNDTSTIKVPFALLNDADEQQLKELTTQLAAKHNIEHLIID